MIKAFFKVARCLVVKELKNDKKIIPLAILPSLAKRKTFLTVRHCQEFYFSYFNKHFLALKTKILLGFSRSDASALLKPIISFPNDSKSCLLSFECSSLQSCLFPFHFFLWLHSDCFPYRISDIKSPSRCFCLP